MVQIIKKQLVRTKDKIQVLISFFLYINNKEVRTIKAFFIKEDDKPNILKQAFNIETIENNQIIVQPIKEDATEKQALKFAKSIRKKCQKNGVNHIVLSKKIKTVKLLTKPDKYPKIIGRKKKKAGEKEKRMEEEMRNKCGYKNSCL